MWQMKQVISEHGIWYIRYLTSCVLGLGVFGFVEVTFESIDTDGPSPRAAAFSWAILLLLLLLDEPDEPFPSPGSDGPPPPILPRLGGVLFLRVFGDFNEILKFSDVCRPFANGSNGPCCWHTGKEVRGLELISRISQIWDLLLDCCADCGICHLARLCMALLSCGEVCGGPAL